MFATTHWFHQSAFFSTAPQPTRNVLLMGKVWYGGKFCNWVISVEFSKLWVIEKRSCSGNGPDICHTHQMRLLCTVISMTLYNQKNVQFHKQKLGFKGFTHSWKDTLPKVIYPVIAFKEFLAKCTNE